MKFVEITSPGNLGRFPYATSLESVHSIMGVGEFRRATGCDIRRMALIDPSGQWLLAAQFEYRAKRVFGGFWFRRAVRFFQTQLAMRQNLEAMRVMQQEFSAAHFPRSLFIRVEPVSELGKRKDFPVLPFLRNKPRNPSSTVLLISNVRARKFNPP